jgi:glycosyltransferase involved in cell wall biosynthesis
MQDLVCISHLRWNFVWQRPQHILSRLSKHYRVTFVEEPISSPTIERPVLNSYVWLGKDGQQEQRVTVLQLMQPGESGQWIGHGDPHTTDTYQKMLKAHLQRQGISNPIVWLYTPMALEFIQTLQPSLIIYDVMDQLSAFKGAPANLTQWDAVVLQQADIVFTGGISLYRDKAPSNQNTYLFPSGVDIDHFARPSVTEKPKDIQGLQGPILGYFGVIDERVDMPLLSSLAQKHPEWNIVMIGPVVKIGHDELAQAPNIHYLGMKSYTELPVYLSFFDVALVPFALNQATRYLSPTKVLEYMAAHKPIVSTPIHDVVELYGSVVAVGHCAEDFIEHAERALSMPYPSGRWTKEMTLLNNGTWDAIVKEMAQIIAYETQIATA